MYAHPGDLNLFDLSANHGMSAATFAVNNNTVSYLRLRNLLGMVND